jgi:hypothetical protein
MRDRGKPAAHAPAASPEHYLTLEGGAEQLALGAPWWRFMAIAAAAQTAGHGKRPILAFRRAPAARFAWREPGERQLEEEAAAGRERVESARGPPASLCRTDKLPAGSITITAWNGH